MAKILKGSTKAGQSMINRASYNEGYYITDVYDRPSIYKENAWKYCFKKYQETEDSGLFRICSHNTFNFSVAWAGKYNGERAIFLKTRDNSYIVLLDKQASWCVSAGSIPALAIQSKQTK